MVGVEEGDDHRKRTTQLQPELLQIHGSPIVQSRMTSELNLLRPMRPATQQHTGEVDREGDTGRDNRVTRTNLSGPRIPG